MYVLLLSSFIFRWKIMKLEHSLHVIKLQKKLKCCNKVRIHSIYFQINAE